MTSHSGVSCDVCMVSNFPGRRYKCLLCDNYDLCGKCHDSESESQNHKSTHPMQCILTEAVAEVFYRGELNSRRSTVSLTCPYCCQSGFIPRTLLAHCADKHSQPGKAPQVVMCPICIATTQRSRSRFVLLADHIAVEHDDGSSIFEDNVASNIVRNVRRSQQHEKFSDDEVDEEPDDNWLNDPENPSNIDPDQRRSDVNRIRAMHLLRNTIAGGHDSSWLTNIGNQVNSNQRRPYSRPTGSRSGRGTYRGVGNHYSRGLSFLSQFSTSVGANHSNTSDPQGSDSSQTSAPSDPNSFFFSQDPLTEFINSIANEHRGTANNATVVPTINPNPSETARLQQQESQQNDGQDAENKNKATAQNKQKRLNQNRIKLVIGTSSQNANPTNQQSASAHSWSRVLSDLENGNQTSTTNWPSGSETPFASAPGNPLSRAANSTQQENEPRSLIARMLREGSNVNKHGTNETRRGQIQDHAAFVHSIILSSIQNPTTESLQTNQATQIEKSSEDHL